MDWLGLAFPVALFATAAATILFAGRKLVRHADAIANGTSLGHGRVGFLLLASATSMPEIVSTVTATTVLDLPDIAVGNLLGTLTLNLAVLAVADIPRPNRFVFAGLYQAHRAMFWAASLTIAIVAFAIFLGPRVPSLGHLGVLSPFLLAGYAWIAVRKDASAPLPTEVPPFAEPLGRAVRWFLVHAAVVAIAATLLPRLANDIAELSGLTGAFVGTALVAVATTLPELAVAWAAVRMGALGLARGNALGSILFNMALLGTLDAFYPRHLLASADLAHVATAGGALAMLAVIGLVRSRRGWSLAPAGLILVLHGLTLAMVYWISS